MSKYKSVLLVEDNLADIELTKEAFSHARVTSDLNIVENGEEALNFLHHNGKHTDAGRPNLILLDLNLPRVSGKEVLKTIKNDPILKTIPVVILTSSDASSDIIDSYNLHANSYVTKPANVNDYIRTIGNILEFWLTRVTLPA